MERNGTPAPAHGKSRTIWTALAIAGAAVVQVSGVGIDLVALAALVCLALLLDRYVADWIGDMAGPGVANLFLAAALGSATWFLFVSADGTTLVQQFMAGAQRQGYEGLIVKSAPAPAPLSTAASADRAARSSASRTASGSSPRPIATRGGGPGGDTGHAVAGDPAIATRTLLQIVPASNGAPALAVASVSSDAGPVRGGVVRFAINGVVRGRARVDRRGQARWRTPETPAGRFAVEARFSGAGRFLPSVSAAASLEIAAGGR